MDDAQLAQATRSGFALSLIAHAAVFLGVFAVLGGAQEFDSRPVEAIAVDIVTPQEAPPEPAPSEPTPPGEESLLPPRQGEAGPDSARQEPQQAGQPDQPPSSQPTQDPPQQVQPPPQQQAAPQTPPEQTLPPQTPPQQTAPEQSPSPQATPQQTPGAPPPTQSIFDPSRIPQLLDIAPPTGDTSPATAPGVDAPAEARANLTAEEVGRLKAHLRSCWKQPRGVDSASRTRVVMRVFLAPDGSLAADPELTSAPGRQEGLLLKQAAEQTLRQCQPFAFLPRERYQEWKILDIDFSPRDMTGG
jgi:hypothetical protein